MLDSRQKGFTLVELLIVIVVIGILAAITFIAYNGIRNRAYNTAATSEIHNLTTQMQLYIADNGGVPQYAYSFGVPNKLQVNPAAYATVGHNNGAICVSADHYAVYILSKSGDVFYSTDGSGSKQLNVTWTDDLTTTCNYSSFTATQGSWEWQSNTWSNWTNQG